MIWRIINDANNCPILLKTVVFRTPRETETILQNKSRSKTRFCSWYRLNFNTRFKKITYTVVDTIGYRRVFNFATLPIIIGQMYILIIPTKISGSFAKYLYDQYLNNNMKVPYHIMCKYNIHICSITKLYSTTSYN